MLSAAHVLAMDSKNLLDVVDSIRIRCPEVEQFLGKSIPTSSSVSIPSLNTEGQPTTASPILGAQS